MKIFREIITWRSVAALLPTEFPRDLWPLWPIIVFIRYSFTLSSHFFSMAYLVRTWMGFLCGPALKSFPPAPGEGSLAVI